jgi:hypothetical protein
MREEPSIHLKSKGVTEQFFPFEGRDVFSLDHEHLHQLLRHLEGDDASRGLDRLFKKFDAYIWARQYDPCGLPPKIQQAVEGSILRR